MTVVKLKKAQKLRRRNSPTPDTRNGSARKKDRNTPQTGEESATMGRGDRTKSRSNGPGWYLRQPLPSDANDVPASGINRPQSAQKSGPGCGDWSISNT